MNQTAQLLIQFVLHLQEDALRMPLQIVDRDYFRPVGQRWGSSRISQPPQARLDSLSRGVMDETRSFLHGFLDERFRAAQCLVELLSLFSQRVRLRQHLKGRGLSDAGSPPARPAPPEVLRWYF